MRRALVELQKDLFRRNRARIQRLEGRGAGALARYEDSYARAVATYRAEASWDELSDAARRADVVWVADYHTLAASKATFLRLVEGALAAAGGRADRIAIGVEFVRARHQRALDRFLAGRLSTRRFLGRIRYRDLWPYDVWPHYRPIFELARRAGIPVVAFDHLEAGMDLAARDRAAADRLAEYGAAHPRRRLYVLVGELHVAPGHLPRELEGSLGRCGQERRSLIVSQNAERIYWRLMERGRAEVDVVKVRRGHYCVISAPPVAQQLSYLGWLDGVGQGAAAEDAAARVAEAARALARWLDVRVGAGELDAEAAAALARWRDRPNAAELDAGDVGAAAGRALRRAAGRVDRGAEDRRELRAAAALDEAAAQFGAILLDHRRPLAPAARAAGRALAAVPSARERTLDAGETSARALGAALGAAVFASLVAGRLTKTATRQLFLALPATCLTTLHRLSRAAR